VKDAAAADFVSEREIKDPPKLTSNSKSRSKLHDPMSDQFATMVNYDSQILASLNSSPSKNTIIGNSQLKNGTRNIVVSNKLT
jgi:hypothetical protein